MASRRNRVIFWAALIIFCVHISYSSSEKAPKTPRSEGHNIPPSKTRMGSRRKSGHAIEKGGSRGDAQELRGKLKKCIDRSFEEGALQSRSENDDDDGDDDDDDGRDDPKEKEMRQEDPERGKTTTWTRGVLAAANKRIASLGRKKKLSEARGAFDDVKLVDGIQQDVYCYTSLINAMCRCGAVDEAESLLMSMPSSGVSPTAATFCAAIRGRCETGDLKGALRLLTEMKKLPGGGGEKVGEGGGGAGREAESSVRVCRTILRGCLREGDAETARDVFESCGGEADVFCAEAACVVQCQRGHPEEGAICLETVLEKRREGIRQGGGGVENAEQTALSRACGVASASFALQGKVGQSEKWLERARRFLAEEHEEGEGGVASKGGEVMGHAGKEKKRDDSGRPSGRGDGHGTSGMVNRLKREHVVSLIDALRGFLDSGKEVGGGADAAIAAGGVLDLRALPCMVEGNGRLQNDGRLAVPEGGMSIEVGSGSGEWARYQAQKSGGSWVCVERRYDRAWDGFAGAALRHVDGLVFACGDSEAFLRDRVVAGSVAHIVCRFPEPPVSSAHGEAWGEEAKGRGHMLAKGFWDAAAAALSTIGNATVITDNLEYARLVARCCSAVDVLESVPLTKVMAGDPTPPGGAPRDIAVREVVEGVFVHRSTGRRGGVDGADMSYFDDLWQAGGHTARYTIVLRKKAGGRSIAGHGAGVKAAQARSFYL